LYDWEIAKIGLIWNKLQQTWMHRPNSTSNLTEFARVAHDEFLRAGFVVNVMWENTLIIDPRTMAPMPITIEVMGRIGEPDEFDHDRKRDEVLKANDRGEQFYGQKDGKVLK
jgi:hypothetical protein